MSSCARSNGRGGAAVEHGQPRDGGAGFLSGGDRVCQSVAYCVKTVVTVAVHEVIHRHIMAAPIPVTGVIEAGESATARVPEA